MYSWGYRAIRIFLHCWWESKMVSSLWKIRKLLNKLNREWPYDSEIPLPNRYLMLIAALFIIHKKWKHLKCLSTTAWINRMCWREGKNFPVSKVLLSGLRITFVRDRLTEEKKTPSFIMCTQRTNKEMET